MWVYEKGIMLITLMGVISFSLYSKRFSGRITLPHCANRKRSCISKIGRGMCEIVADALELQYQLFSVDSAKIITGLIPFYIGMREIDEDFQNKFYDPIHHKNKNQMPATCHKIAQKGVGLPMVFLSGLTVYGWTEDLRLTGRMFLIGLPFVHWGKDLIKQANAKCCLRPWHENFSCEKRSTGGFPSGHMANVTYMTTLFGLRHGFYWALPLGLFATFVFADFVNCNRHYLSQLLAGAGLGALYGVAASKVVDKKLSERVSFSVKCDSGPAVELCYQF